MSDTANLLGIAAGGSALGTVAAIRIWTDSYAGKQPHGAHASWWPWSRSLWDPWSRTVFVAAAMGLNAFALISLGLALNALWVSYVGVLAVGITIVLMFTTYVWGRPRFLVAPSFRTDAPAVFPSVGGARGWFAENRFGLVVSPICFAIVIAAAVALDAVDRAVILGAWLALWLVVWFGYQRWRGGV